MSAQGAPARTALAVTIAAAIVAPLSPPAAASYKVGIGDQHPQIFGDPLFNALRVRYARLVVPYDALSNGYDRSVADAWLGAAHARGIRPLVSFNHSRIHPRRLPSTRAYRRAFKQFRARYPWIRDYSPWNEVNHQSQPTFHKPKWAARYYNVVRASCRHCTIVAADVLDQAGLTQYLRGFKRYANGHPRLWGLHNYSDTNRFRSRGTRELLRAVPGRIWLTETGGIVKFARTLPYSTRRAARATKYMFKLAGSSRRIKRLYVYSWKGEVRGARFDAGLVGPNGRARPAYYVVKKKMKGHR